MSTVCGLSEASDTSPRGGIGDPGTCRDPKHWSCSSRHGSTEMDGSLNFDRATGSVRILGGLHDHKKLAVYQKSSAGIQHLSSSE